MGKGLEQATLLAATEYKLTELEKQFEIPSVTVLFTGADIEPDRFANVLAVMHNVRMKPAPELLAASRKISDLSRVLFGTPGDTSQVKLEGFIGQVKKQVVDGGLAPEMCLLDGDPVLFTLKGVWEGAPFEKVWNVRKATELKTAC